LPLEPAQNLRVSDRVLLHCDVLDLNSKKKPASSGNAFAGDMDKRFLPEPIAARLPSEGD
jgi:hypothetical protein